MYKEIELNKPLSTGHFVRLFLGKTTGHAVVKANNDSGLFSMKDLRREIYRHLEAAGWERFEVTNIEVGNLGGVAHVFLERTYLKPEAEAWTSFLGGVLSLPPEA